MVVTKIMLSEDELQLVQNSGWILTKNAIIGKVYTMFGNVAELLHDHVNERQHSLPENCSTNNPKISKGEKYEDLPYVMLDYPRFFTKEEIVAVRNFFWWGNYFSTTLHVRGLHRHKVAASILEQFEYLAAKQFYLSTGGSEWDHNIDGSNYSLLNGYSKTALSDVLEKSNFIKLAVKFPLKEWSIAEKQLENSSIEMLTLL
ncbi:hypothetical protein [Pinibacter soli]|uniref:Uncharacterized protein n=1 Tax=Pinibacter soli TaxID=3044211 RepID=A0ABT6R6W5_9BACT|nr:hypothetical protein [Pinibacter soli]MDI3318211.1 hypothetical protein [Pinibacter soli]